MIGKRGPRPELEYMYVLLRCKKCATLRHRMIHRVNRGVKGQFYAIVITIGDEVGMS